jgi:hypothetical protein
VGTDCAGKDDAFCDGGQQGIQIICDDAAHTCQVGCHSDLDCPKANVCDMTQQPYSCVQPPASPQPLGADCTGQNDTYCNAGNAGSQEICDNSACATGCHTDFDCPTDSPFCDTTQTPGGCVASLPNPQPLPLNSDCTGKGDAFCDAGMSGIEEVCISDECVTGCHADSDCPADRPTCNTTDGIYKCVALSASCGGDADCTGGQTGTEVVCDNGTCNNGCNADSDCTASAPYCDPSSAPGTCAATPPSPQAAGTDCAGKTDAFCDAGMSGLENVCINDQCATGCHANSDCPGARPTCNLTDDADQCVQLGGSCAQDSDCNGGMPGTGVVCSTADSTCIVACHADGDCPASKPTCDMTTDPYQCM